MGYAIRVEPGAAVDLAAIEPRQDGGLSKSDGQKRFAALAAELGALQELLYAAGKQGLLVVLQGMDTSGKDGAIRHVFARMDPQGVQVAPFRAPTPDELAHDFLWRVHPHAPARGMAAVFNRSHYEAVIVERVRELTPERIWRQRYAQINAFESLLTDNATIIVKFFLHISKAEQQERLLAREADPAKAWKLSAGDWADRRRWDDYQRAWQDALSRCSTTAAPWWIVPADRKWFRNLAMAEVLVERLQPLADDWRADLRQRGARELAAIQAERMGERTETRSRHAGGGR
ncbi:MAG: polyphosphate kinase 2 family protein [Thermomicrobiales bacterium]|nr:polyphosphate kinase 2 family protein [Thermomicrobiales bacterium]